MAIFLFFPETKGLLIPSLGIENREISNDLLGKTLEQMNEVFGDKIDTYNPGKITPLEEKASVEKAA